MRTIYLYKDEKDYSRKVLLDMAFLSTYKKIRLPKYQYENDLYFLFNKSGETGKYFLSKERITKEDENYYYFSFPFKPEQVESSAV